MTIKQVKQLRVTTKKIISQWIKSKISWWQKNDTPTMKLVHKSLNLTSRIFNILFISIGTIVLIYYSKGYRFNPDKTELTPTGVLSIVSQPRNASIYINGEKKANTPKSIGSLSVGNYTIEVKKNGYYTWKKVLPIKSGLSTPYNVLLFLKGLKLDKEIEIKGVIENVQHSNDHLFITVSQEEQPKQNTQKSKTLSNDSINNKLLQIYFYRFNNGFWNFHSNPILIYETILAQDTENLSLLPSPNGNKAILIKTTTNNNNTDNNKDRNSDKDNNQSDEIKTYYLLDVESSNVNRTATITEIDFNKIKLETPQSDSRDFTLTWTKNSQHVIVDLHNRVYSIDTKLLTNKNSTDSITLLYEQEGDQTIWDTDANGYFYYLEQVTPINTMEINTEIGENENSENSNQDEISHYRINRINLSNITYNTQENVEKTKKADYTNIINDIYTTTEDKYIDKATTEHQENLYNPFKNSVECRHFWGTPTDINIQSEEDGIAITTDRAIYWYDSTLKKYSLVSYKSPTFQSFSPNQDNFLYTETIKTQPSERHTLAIYTFDKINADHLTKLGSHTILRKLENIQPNSIKWLADSTHIAYIKNKQTKQKKDTLYLIDLDGDNQTAIISQEHINNYVIDSKLESLFTVLPRKDNEDSNKRNDNTENSSNTNVDNEQISNEEIEKTTVIQKYKISS